MEELKLYLDGINFDNDFVASFDCIKQKCLNKKVLLYGAGKFFEYVFSKFNFSCLDIIGISDLKFKDSNINNYFGYKVIDPDKILDTDFDVVLVTVLSHKKVICSLKNKLKSRNVDVIPLYCEPYLKQIQILMTKHCNMNCVACSHFSPIADEEFYSFDDFAKDMKRLHQFFPKLPSIWYLGGEPLLHKDLIKFIKYGRELFPNANNAIISNGLLIKSMKDDFWESLVENNVSFYMTAYPVLVDKFDEISKYLDSKKVKYNIYLMDRLSDGRLDFFKRFNTDASADINTSWESCHSKVCHTLYNGKFGGCYFPLVADIANKKFGLNIEYSDSMLNIHDEKVSARDIEKLCNTPQEICKYCDSKYEYIDWYRCDKNSCTLSEFFVRQN